MPTSYHFFSLKPNPKVSQTFAQKTLPSCQFRGRLFPSGRLTVGRIPRKEILKSDVEYERVKPDTQYGCRSHWDYREGLVKEYYSVQTPLLPLGSSSDTICHKPRAKKYGLNGIGRRARQSILEAASVLSSRYGRRLGFYTFTCPYRDESLVYEFNRNFSEIVRRFFQEVKRAYARRNVPFYYIAVFEVQGQRFADSGVPVLHCHWAAPCYFENSREFVLSADEYRSIYGRVLQSVVGGEFSTSACIDSQVVKKTVAGYLSKYLSKGCGECGNYPDVAPCQVPSRWWSVSRKLLMAVKSSTIELSQDLCRYLLYTDVATVLSSLSAFYCKPIFIHWAGQEIRVGVALALPLPVSSHLRPHDYYVKISEML